MAYQARVSRRDWSHDLVELLADPKCKDWPTKLQLFCRDTWEVIDQTSSVEVRFVEHFVKLLIEKEHAFELASLVIPAFRDEVNETTENVWKRQIIRAVSPLRQKAKSMLWERSEIDDKHYQQEKQVYNDAEVYRACLLLQNSGTLKEDLEHEIRDWLKRAPWCSGAGRQGA